MLKLSSHAPIGRFRIPFLAVILIISLLSLSSCSSVGVKEGAPDKNEWGGECGEVFRLHIRANSDSVYDQNIKREVALALAPAIEEMFEDSDSVSSAVSLASEQSDALATLASDALASLGAPYGATVTVGTTHFPDKYLASTLYPEGDYPALVIHLGEGEGENWWCLLFPSLIPSDVIAEETDDALEVGISPEGYRDIVDSDEPFRLRFKIIDILSELFSSFGR
jgi:stage II sporulation protein R